MIGGRFIQRQCLEIVHGCLIAVRNVGRVPDRVREKRSGFSAKSKIEWPIAVDAGFPADYLPCVSTAAEIEAVLPNLSTEELLRIERAVHRQFVQRSGGIVYKDSYGIVTEADLIASAEAAFQAYDQAESENAKPKAR